MVRINNSSQIWFDASAAANLIVGSLVGLGDLASTADAHTAVRDQGNCGTMRVSMQIL